MNQAAVSDGRRRESEPAPRAYTIKQFCTVYGISHDTYYKMAREGWGPKIMKVGHKTLISVEAADAWRREREAEGERQKKGDTQ